MSARDWYYCDAERDSEIAHGPVSLARLAELIRSGELPYDVLVSTEAAPGPTWVHADRLEELLEAIPLDRERLAQEYIGYGEAPEGQENWGWASDRMYSLLEAVPELAWTLVVEMIERAPSDASLSFLAAGRRTCIQKDRAWPNGSRPEKLGTVSASTNHKRTVTTRVFRAGEALPEDDWLDSSIAERIDAVWELTRQCLAWNRTESDEPRLQRSVSRVQRSNRRDHFD